MALSSIYERMSILLKNPLHQFRNNSQILNRIFDLDKDHTVAYTIVVRYIAVKWIALKQTEEISLDAHIKKVYVPMTETGFYILLCLQEPNHGYGIVQRVKELTKGDIVLAPGTMYGSLSKMEKDGLIRFLREEDKRKIYMITDLGREVLETETKRIERLYKNMKEMR